MKYLALLMLIVFAACNNKQAQSKAKDIASQVQEGINTQRFIFNARTMLPTSGRTIQLNSRYTLEVMKDTLMAYLPYYGEVYVPQIDPSKGGINFTSKKFDYQKEVNKKGGWRISIKPHDTEDVQQMFLMVTSSGSATLQITSRTRQAISYNGYVEKKLD